MSDEQPVKKRRFRIIKRTMTLSVIVLLVGVALVSIGVAITWGHFWDFRIGGPTSESCTNCHVMEPYVESLTTTAVLGGSHSARNIDCIDCHDYDIDHQVKDTVAYLTGKYQEPLEQQSYGMDFCFRCHEHGSYDQIAWRTMDIGVTDPQAKGNSANPHQSPHYSELECNLCHRVHTPSTLYCWDCHTYDFGNPQFVREALTATPESTPPAN